MHESVFSNRMNCFNRHQNMLGDSNAHCKKWNCNFYGKKTAAAVTRTLPLKLQ